MRMKVWRSKLFFTPENIRTYPIEFLSGLALYRIYGVFAILGYPEEERASLQVLQQRQSQAPTLFWGCYDENSLLLGVSNGF